jgi:RNA polymerase sigma factor (sigma-70 family)
LVCYKTRHFEDLAAQLVRAPYRLCLRHLSNIEFAMSVISDDKRYPFDFFRRAVTGVRAGVAGQDTLVRGADLRCDLVRLAESLSAGARLPLAACRGGASFPDQLAKRFKVSRKTISRWRERGLTAWKVVAGDGRLRVAFPESAVRRFVRENSALVRKAAGFTQLTPADTRRIVELTREAMAEQPPSRNAVIEAVAARVGRVRETVRQVLIRHDREHPNEALFRESTPTDGADWRRVRVWEACRDGASVASIAERFDMTSREAYEIMTEMRARTLKSAPIEFTDADEFRTPAIDQELRDCEAARNPYAPLAKARAPIDLPPLLAELYRRPLLTAEGERALFRKMNYLKHRAETLRQALDPERVSASELDQIDALLDEAARIKNQITCANLRLVVHVARRHASPRRDLFELISDGNEVLMRAVDRFDYSRGFKFSTYCTWSLMRRFARRSFETHRRQSQFVTGQENCLRDVVAIAPAADDRLFANEMLQQMSSVLTDRQWSVLKDRYGLSGGGNARTLTEIGDQLGVSKERVRQIENESLSKLRAKFGGAFARAS